MDPWEEGWDVRGYFAWSLVDNYEWALGWDVRYGLFALDEASHELIPKPSAELFRKIVAAEVIP